MCGKEETAMEIKSKKRVTSSGTAGEGKCVCGGNDELRSSEGFVSHCWN